MHGWRLMFADRHPYAGGEDHYAAYLENRDGLRGRAGRAAGLRPGWQARPASRSGPALPVIAGGPAAAR